MSDAKAIKISKLIDRHREIENLRLSGEITGELSTEIELSKNNNMNLGCHSASKAEQQLLRRLDKIEHDRNLIDLQSKNNISS
jgi:hypothetical protein